MSDPLFQQALYWFMLNPTVVLFVFGAVTSTIILIMLFLLLRKWGDYT